MDTGAPQIPSLKETQKRGGLAGLASGLSFAQRLSQFKKKDLAFITAGLSFLFMAPVAEHFLMNPDAAGTGAMTPGWDMKKGAGFGDGSSPYESGVNGLAPGGVTGGGDVITPLNVRDPASLIMGPGATQQPAATATTPPAPKNNDSGDWKDAIANAGSSAAKKAMEKAGLPVPKPSLANAGLRGLGAVSGGGGGSYTLPPVSAGLAPNKAAESNSLQRVQAPPGFRGVGRRGGENASAGSMENLKKAAAGAVDAMNRRGSAVSAAEQAASLGMGGGSSGGGAGAGGPDGSADKAASGSQNKDSSNVGESLDFLRRKAEQDKALDLQWKKKEKAEMLWPNLQEKMLEEAMMGPLKGAIQRFNLQLKTMGSTVGGGSTIKCKSPQNRSFKSGDVGKCTMTAEESTGIPYLWDEQEGKLWRNGSMLCNGSAAYWDCVKVSDSDAGGGGGGGGGGGDGGKKEKLPPGNLTGIGPGVRSGLTLNEICAELEQLKSPDAELKGSDAPHTKSLVEKMKTLISQVRGADVSLTGTGAPGELICGAKSVVAGEEERNVETILKEQRQGMKDALKELQEALDLGKSAGGKVQVGAEPVSEAAMGFLTTYIEEMSNAERGNNPGGTPRALEALQKAVEEVKKHDSVYEEAGKILQGDGRKEPGAIARLEKGKVLLDSIKGPLDKASGEVGYLSQVSGLLQSADEGRDGISKMLESNADLQRELDLGGVKRAKSWVLDIGDNASKVRQDSYKRLLADAKEIRDAHDKAVEATREGGSVSSSVSRAKEAVGYKGQKDTQKSQLNLAKWSEGNIRFGPANISSSQSGAQAMKELKQRSDDVVKEAAEQAKEADGPPKKDLGAARAALGEEGAP